MMRILWAIGAAVVLASAAAATPGRADTANRPAAQSCHGPRVERHHVRHRRVRHHAWWRRHRWMPPGNYNPGLPSPWNSDYDRAMVLHFRSPPVSGTYQADLGYAPTPPVLAVQPYRYPAHGTVLQYDGLTGEYIALAPADAARVLPRPPAKP